MRDWINLCEAALEVQEQGMGLKVFYNDDVILAGGMRVGSSPANYMRNGYTILDRKLHDQAKTKEEIQAATCGSVHVWEGRDGIAGLVNIKIETKARRGGHGRKTVEALCDTCKTHFHVSDIKKGAVSFWAKLGCVFFRGTKQITAAEARKGGMINGVIPKQGCSDPIEDYASLNRGKA